MRDMPFFPVPLREAAIAITLIGMGLIAASGARGPGSLTGFGMFCFGMAALDGLHRSTFGLRQISLFLGIFAAGLGLWSAIATGLLVLLELPVAPELRSLLIAAAACAAGSAAAALLAVRSPAWLRGRRVWTGLVGVAGRLFARVSRLGGPRRDRPYDAGRPWRPAGPMQGG